MGAIEHGRGSTGADSDATQGVFARTNAGLAALAVLLVSSVALRFAAALHIKGPWIAPDEMLYALSGRSFWESGHLRVLDSGEVFYGLYPVLAGAPLALFGPDTGQIALKALQVLLVTATAVIAYVWTRQITAARWALLAATLTLALPAFAYSGLIMTESVFLPSSLLSLWLLSRALETAKKVDQTLAIAGVALATMARLQGLAIVPTCALALVLMAWFSRDWRIFRTCRVMIAGLGVLTLGWIILRGSSETGPLGAYGVAADSDYDVRSALTWIVRTAGDLFLIVVVAPAIAALILAVHALRGRERDPKVRALVAAGVSYALITVVVVGAFSSVYVGRLAERNLVSAAPAFFVMFSVWLSRGAPRPQPATSLIALFVGLPTIFLPVRELVTSAAVPDAFMSVPLLLVLNHSTTWVLELTWSLTVAVLIVLIVLLPPRAASMFGAGIVLLVLVSTSFATQHEVERRVAVDRSMFFGKQSPDWIDRATSEPVAYLYDDDPLSNGIWQQAYWNKRIRTIATMSPDFRLPASRPLYVTARPNGRLRYNDGRKLNERLVVAPTTIALFGRRIATLDQGRYEPGLALWKADDLSPRLATRVQGTFGKGYFADDATVTVFACAQGELEVELAESFERRAVTFSSPGFQPVTVPIPAGRPWRGAVPAPPTTSGDSICRFHLAADPPSARATRFEFVRHPVSRTRFVVVPATKYPDSRVGYCLGGDFVNLLFGQPERDLRYRDAVPAIFVEGVGLTCAAPPSGYSQQGFATAAQGVPPDVYPYYVP